MGLTLLASSINKKMIIDEVFGNKDWTYFWEARFLPRWLPLLLGLTLGIVEAYLINAQLWHIAIPLAVAVPTIILFSRYPFMAILVWLLLFPYFLNEFTAAGRSIYWLLHRAIPPIGLMIALLSDWLGIRKRPNIRLGRAELCTVFFVGMLSINILLLSKSGLSATFIKAYDLIFMPLCLYWLIRLTTPTQKDMERLLWVAFLTVIAQAAIGVTSWFAPELLPRKWLGLEGERTVGSLRNVAVYTSTLLFCALLLFQYGVNHKSRWLRYGLYLTFGLALYCIFMSFSRGSWLGEAVILTFLIFIYPKTMVRFIVAASIIMAVLSGTILAGQTAWGYERLTGQSAQQSAESRATANIASLNMLAAKPFFGWGFGNYDREKRPFMERVGDIRVYNETSHNTYLSVLAELGSVGFFLYYFPALWWLILSIKVWRQLPNGNFWDRRLLLMLWLVVLHMFIVTNFMDMIRYFPFGNAMWWLTLALIGNMIGIHRNAVEAQSTKQQTRTRSIYVYQSTHL